MSLGVALKLGAGGVPTRARQVSETWKVFPAHRLTLNISRLSLVSLRHALLGFLQELSRVTSHGCLWNMPQSSRALWLPVIVGSLWFVVVTLQNLCSRKYRSLSTS